MIQKLTIHDFDKIFSLMQLSFPKDEYRPYEKQKELFQNPKYSIYGLPDPERNDIKGFISAWQFRDFVFIEHFAVNPAYRNQGLGSHILQELVSMTPYQLCLEVELPENHMTRRRIGFYERNNFVLNDYPYIQPSMAAGQNPVPLMIMTSQNRISQDRFEQIRTVLYKEVYQVSCSE